MLVTTCCGVAPTALEGMELPVCPACDEVSRLEDRTQPEWTARPSALVLTGQQLASLGSLHKASGAFALTFHDLGDQPAVRIDALGDHRDRRRTWLMTGDGVLTRSLPLNDDDVPLPRDAA